MVSIRPVTNVEVVFSRARAYQIIPGFVGTYADLIAAVEDFEGGWDVAPDEDGERAFLRYAEGGWHGGYYDEEDRAGFPF